MKKVVAVLVLMLVAGTAYAGFGFGWGCGYPWYGHYARYYGYPYYWWYPSYVGYTAYYDPMVDVRIEVKPKDASVFVDGYYAGQVDSFDGWYQHLTVSPGRHTITVRHPGYTPYSVTIQGVYGQNIHIKHQLVPGEDKLPDDSRMQLERKGSGYGRTVPPEQYPERTPSYQAPQTAPRPEPKPDRDPGYQVPPATPRPESTQPRRPQATQGQGLLRMTINQPDTSVYIDGNFWGVIRTTGAVDIGLAVGTHRIEAVKPGFQTYRQDVKIDEGRDAALEIVLVPDRSTTL